jgi:hypothetical protein
VDYYDGNQLMWFATELSEARYSLVAVTLNSTVFFAGGIANNSQLSDVVDVSFATYSREIH